MVEHGRLDAVFLARIFVVVRHQSVSRCMADDFPDTDPAGPGDLAHRGEFYDNSALDQNHHVGGESIETSSTRI